MSKPQEHVKDQHTYSTFSLRIPDKLKDTIMYLAAKREQTATSLILEILRDYIYTKEITGIREE